MSTQYCTIYLVRHGQTQWNVDQMIQGQMNIPLTKRGEEQAHEQRKQLEGVVFTHIYSSDLIRAQRTAEILNLERKLAIQTTEAIRERYFGLYQGKTMEEGRKKLWDLLSHYSTHPHIQESHVETNEQMIGRSITFLREISVAHPNENVLVVSHGGVMRLILLHLGFATEKTLPSGAIQNLAFIKLSCDGIEFKVEETRGITLTKEA